jgi:hypothetical protein
MIEELEQQIVLPSIGKNNVEIHSGSPIRASSSPSYPDIIKKKTVKISRSSKDESFERPSKRSGIKSHKEAREEEVERQKFKESNPPLKFPSKGILEQGPQREVLPTPVNNAYIILEL